MKNITIATAAAAGFAAAFVGLAAPALAAPSGSGSAADTISALEAQGNRVIVNRENGAALHDSTVVAVRQGHEIQEYDLGRPARRPRPRDRRPGHLRRRPLKLPTQGAPPPGGALCVFGATTSSVCADTTPQGAPLRRYRPTAKQSLSCWASRSRPTSQSERSLPHASRRAGHHCLRQPAPAADPSHQRHPAADAGRGVPRRHRHQLADHPQRVGRAGEVHLRDRRRAQPDAVQRRLPDLRHRDPGVAVRDPHRADRRAAMEAARRLRRGRCHRHPVAVDHRQRHRRAALALRSERTSRHRTVAVPRRPAVDRDAGRGPDGVGSLAARALAAMVVGAAAGVRADPPRRQRGRAGTLAAGARGGLVRRRTGRARRRHTRAGGPARRRSAGDDAPGVPGVRAEGGPAGRAWAVGAHRHRGPGSRLDRPRSGHRHRRAVRAASTRRRRPAPVLGQAEIARQRNRALADFDASRRRAPCVDGDRRR